MLSQISVEYVKAHQSTRLQEATQARLARQARAGRAAGCPRLLGIVLQRLSMTLHRARGSVTEQAAGIGALPQ